MLKEYIITPEKSPIVFKSDEASGSDASHLASFLENTNIEIVKSKNKIFVRKNINNRWYETLFENDYLFFGDLIKTRKKTNFTSLNRSFEPQESDWECIRKYCNMVYVIITNKCNAECRICFAQGVLHAEEMDVEDVKFVISKIGRNKKFMFFGLEPTTKDDLCNMIRLVRDSHNIPTLFTNGLKLADPHYVKKLKECGLKEVFLSLDGFKAVYTKLGNENDYNLKMQALENLKQYKIFTSLALVLMDSINENEISRLIPFLIENRTFIKGLFLVPLSPFGKLEIVQERFFTYSDIIKNIIGSSRVKCEEKYFSEFERFKFNIHNLLIKFRNNIPTGSHIITVPFKIRNNSLEGLFPTKHLEHINHDLEEGRLFKLCKYIPHLIDFCRLLLNYTRFYYKNLEKGLVFMSIYQITTDFNYIPFWTHSVGIIKQKDKKGKDILVFNCI